MSDLRAESPKQSAEAAPAEVSVYGLTRSPR